MDSKFILSGSDDTNLRIWKAKASDPMQVMLPREKEKISYNDKLKKKYNYFLILFYRYQFNQEIKRILRHKHLPKLILKKNRIK